MSRSYREPWYVDSYGTKSKRLNKRYANRRVRKTKDVPDGKAYRKYTNPWDIVDWKYRWDPWPSIRISPFTGEYWVIWPEPKWKAIRK